jgi:hypothetical protein
MPPKWLTITVLAWLVVGVAFLVLMKSILA